MRISIPRLKTVFVEKQKSYPMNHLMDYSKYTNNYIATQE